MYVCTSVCSAQKMMSAFTIRYCGEGLLEQEDCFPLCCPCANGVHPCMRLSLSFPDRNLHINGIDELIIFLGSNPNEVCKGVPFIAEWGREGKVPTTNKPLDK